MAKRAAAYQLTSDNFDALEEEENYGGKVGEFSKASGDIMAKRVIKKAKKRMDGSGAAITNPANIFSGFTSSTHKNGASNVGTEKSSVKLLVQGKEQSNTSVLFGKAESSSNPFGNALKSSTKDNSKDNTAMDSRDSSDKSNEKEKDALYNSQIAALNTSFLNWINLHVEKNPLVDLTPVFKDYTKYMDDIESKYGKASTSEVNTFSVITSTRVDTDEKKITTGSTMLDEKIVVKSEAVSSPFAGFSQSAGSSKTSISGFFSAAQTSTPTFPTIVSKVKEEEKKVEGGDEEPDDFEKDERKTVVEEDAFYTMRCKLFFKKGNDWKDLGVGMLYLKSLSDGKTQLLIRMETAAGKVLLNISLHKNLPVAKVGKNNVSVMSVPNPPVFLKETEGDNTKPLNYLIRVKNSDEADDLMKQINDNKIKC